MRKHAFYYLTLISIIIIAVFAIIEYQNQKQTQQMAVVTLGIIYFGWGIMHHKLHHSLRPKIVLEYFAVAALGVAAILFILKSVL